MNRPKTTLFMLTSVDGKISTGDKDVLDFDTDLPKIKGVKEGLRQYYDLEQQTSLFSLNSGKVQAKIGANKQKGEIKKLPVSFLIVDNKPHLNLNGVDYFINKSKNLYLITTNKNHPAFKRQKTDNLTIIFYKNKIDFVDLFKRFKKDYKIGHITIQTGGSLNSELLQSNLVDHISLVVAPALVGGTNTPSLVGGIALHTQRELSKIKALKLRSCDVLKNSYLHLQYDVINDTKINFLKK